MEKRDMRVALERSVDQVAKLLERESRRVAQCNEGALTRRDPGSHFRDSSSDGQRDRLHSVSIAMQQLSRAHRQSSETYGSTELHDMHIAVGYGDTRREIVKAGSAR